MRTDDNAAHVDGVEHALLLAGAEGDHLTQGLLVTGSKSQYLAVHQVLQRPLQAGRCNRARFKLLGLPCTEIAASFEEGLHKHRLA